MTAANYPHCEPCTPKNNSRAYTTSIALVGPPHDDPAACAVLNLPVNGSWQVLSSVSGGLHIAGGETLCSHGVVEPPACL